MVEDILDFFLEVAFAVLSFPIVLQFGIAPWINFGGFNSTIEKTAIETSGELDGKNLGFTGADAYLSLAVADEEQPEPIKVRYYVGANQGDKEVLDVWKDGLNEAGKDSLSDTEYYQVYYSTQYEPSAINSKVTVGKKVMQITNYDQSRNVELLLRPKVGDTKGDKAMWCWNLRGTEMKGDSVTKSQRHEWLRFK